MAKEPQKLDVGQESVVVGYVEGKIGDRCVVIGPTDNKGNTILNRDTAIGNRAYAGPGSVAVGHEAGAAGSPFAQLTSELAQLQNMMRQLPDSAAHQDAIAAVGQAAEAAKNNDEAGVLHYLKAAGRWAFDFATKAGASLTAHLLAKVLNI
jgi:hypothetical protein